MAPIVVTATMQADARAQITRAGHWQLALEAAALRPCAGRVAQVRAVVPYGTGEAAAVACRNRANTLRRGVRVVLHAGAWWARAGRMVLDEIDHLETPDLQDRHQRVAP